jgi:hypothetical protein
MTYKQLNVVRTASGKIDGQAVKWLYCLQCEQQAFQVLIKTKNLEFSKCTRQIFKVPAPQGWNHRNIGNGEFDILTKPVIVH